MTLAKQAIERLRKIRKHFPLSKTRTKEKLRAREFWFENRTNQVVKQFKN